jgi:hypothetical protein
MFNSESMIYSLQGDKNFVFKFKSDTQHFNYAAKIGAAAEAKKRKNEKEKSLA